MSIWEVNAALSSTSPPVKRQHANGGFAGGCLPPVSSELLPPPAGEPEEISDVALLEKLVSEENLPNDDESRMVHDELMSIMNNNLSPSSPHTTAPPWVPPSDAKRAVPACALPVAAAEPLPESYASALPMSVAIPLDAPLAMARDGAGAADQREVAAPEEPSASTSPPPSPVVAAAAVVAPAPAATPPPPATPAVAPPPPPPSIPHAHAQMQPATLMLSLPPGGMVLSSCSDMQDSRLGTVLHALFANPVAQAFPPPPVAQPAQPAQAAAQPPPATQAQQVVLHMQQLPTIGPLPIAMPPPQPPPQPPPPADRPPMAQPLLQHPAAYSSCAHAMAVPVSQSDSSQNPQTKPKADKPAGGGGPLRNVAERRDWSVGEDDLIIASVVKHGCRWRVIASMLPGRSDDAVRNRYTRLRELGRATGEKPAGGRHGDRRQSGLPGGAGRPPAGKGRAEAASGATGPRTNASSDESSRVSSASSDDGSEGSEGTADAATGDTPVHWTTSSSSVGDAGPSAAAARAHSRKEKAAPADSGPCAQPRPKGNGRNATERTSWSRVDDDMIIRSVAELGHKWGKISQRLPGRTEHAIRNRYSRLQSLQQVQGQLPAAASTGAAPLPDPGSSPGLTWHQPLGIENIHQMWD